MASELENVYWIDMSDASLRSDVLHFDSTSTEYLGKMMFNKLVELKLVEAEPLEVNKSGTEMPVTSRDAVKPTMTEQSAESRKAVTGK